MNKDCKTIFLVTCGEYSDYRVCGVFDDKELAQKYINSFSEFDTPRIEEYVLNPYKNELKSDYKPFFLRMNKEGVCIELEIKDSNYGLEGSGLDYGFDIENNLYISVFAKNEQHAIKICNEKRGQLIAQNRWKE